MLVLYVARYKDETHFECDTLEEALQLAASIHWSGEGYPIRIERDGELVIGGDALIEALGGV